jgi:hypothetical protein
MTSNSLQPRDGAPRSSCPPPPPPAAETGRAPATPAQRFLADIFFFLRQLTGTLLVLVCGWGLILASIWLAQRRWLPAPPLLAGGIAALASLGLFWMLQQELWLSRFLNLHRGSWSNRLSETLYLWLLGVPGLFFRRRLRSEVETGTAASAAAQTDSLRETVETVVFVIVLVLLLKTFVAEAFVIPTGSMATTLLGYHRLITCPQCGLTFPVNVSQEVDPSDGLPQPITGCTCPNCRWHLDLPRTEAAEGPPLLLLLLPLAGLAFLLLTLSWRSPPATPGKT